MIQSILLVPVPAWRERVLIDGPLNAGMPVMFYGHVYGHRSSANDDDDGGERWRLTESELLYDYLWGQMVKAPHALVLAHEGKIVREGCDRLDWCLFNGPEGVVPGRWSISPSRTPMLADLLSDSLFRAWQQAWVASDRGIGEVVTLDADMQPIDWTKAGVEE
jgi:hypothetical protein